MGIFGKKKAEIPAPPLPPLPTVENAKLETGTDVKKIKKTSTKDRLKIKKGIKTNNLPTKTGLGKIQ
jgi:hypothetical protein